MSALLNWKSYLLTGLIAAVLTAVGVWVLKGDLDSVPLEKEVAAHAKDNADHANQRAAISAAAASDASAALAKQTDLQAQIDALTTSHAKENEYAEKSMATLRAAYRNGQQQLLVHATCTGTDTAGDSSGHSDVAGTIGQRDEITQVGLDPADADALLSIVGDGDDGLRALKEAQDYICTIRPKTDGCVASAAAP